jgi:hypothetical protein
VRHHLVTLVLNLITLVVTITATRRRPILSYKLLVALSFLAVGCDLWALLSGHDSIWVLYTTTALVLAMLVRIGWDRHGARSKKRQAAETPPKESLADRS